MSKQKDLFGKDIKEQPSKEKEPRQQEECKICRHCGYIPTYNDFYCWTLEGLCTDVLDYCKENRCYEPSIDKLEVIDILGRKFKRIESDKKNFVRKGIAELELEKAREAHINLIKEKFEKIRTILERYDHELCVRCGTELTLEKYDGHGNPQEYCAKCERFGPNSEDLIIEKLIEIIRE